MNDIKLSIGITGASGSIYAKRLLKKLQSLQIDPEKVAVIFSDTAKQVWEYELGQKVPLDLPFQTFDNSNLFAPPSSGSSGYNTMIIIPCSMGTLGRIVAGTANDLISRSADVMIKERKKLIIVAREMPYSLIHLKNMEQITLAGGIIIPASPSFYSKPRTIEAIIDTVVDKTLQLAGYHFSSFSWGKE
ncbi:MAG: UbiX family flavin prenyltransferase [Bacteroidales bacterium]|nr:UbiX family flavin prenyltransferase [Bacteroidales bacterium]